MSAIKTRIKWLQEGKFVENYIISPMGFKTQRVRVLGTVVGKFLSEDGAYCAITLDDGTDTIRIKAFKDIKPLEGLKEGDIVDVIGSVRQYEGEIYIIPEIVRAQDINFELMRRTELVELEKMLKEKKELFARLSTQYSGEQLEAECKKYGLACEAYETAVTEQPKEEKIEGVKEKLLKKIIELDSGEGVQYESLLAQADCNKQETESALYELLESGEVYEPRAGVYKKL